MFATLMIPVELRRDDDAEDEDFPRTGRSGRVHAAVSLAWDETQETLCLGLNKELRLTQEECAWQVMVSTSTVIAVLVPNDEQQPITADAMIVVRPPVALTHTGAEAMWHGLFCVPVAKNFVKLCQNYDEHADIFTQSFARDGAGTNSRLAAHAFATLYPSALSTDKKCELHGMKLNQTAVSQLAGKRLLGQIFSLSLMFRSATQYFLRLTYSVESFVKSRIIIRSGAPPHEAAAYTQAIISVVTDSSDTKRLNTVNYDDTPDASSMPTNSPTIIEWWHELSRWLNGCWWLDSGHCVHYTTSMITPEYTAKVVTRVARALRNTVFYRKPKIPASNKWTQLTDCVCWIVLSVAPHNLLSHLYAFALNAISLTIQTEAARFHKQQGFHTHEQALNWHAVQGKRMNEGRCMYESQDALMKLWIMMIALEVLHFYATWLILRGGSAHDAKLPPPLLCLVNLIWSPFIVMRQYFAGCLQGYGPRVLLLIRRAGTSSVREWITTNPTQARQFRRTILTADAWTYRRQEQEFTRWPWRAASIADMRIPFAERLATATQWLSERCRFCLDEFFCRRFVQRFAVSAMEFVSDRFYISVILEWARSVLVHIGGVETRHARNRQGSTTGQTWVNFVTRYVNREAQSIRSIRAQMWRIARREDTARTPTLMPSLDGSFMRRISSARRSKTPFEVFSVYESVRRRLNNEKAYVTTKEFPLVMKRKWVDLTSDDTAKFTAISDATQSIAKAYQTNRKQNQIVLAHQSSADSVGEPARHANPMLNLLNEWIASPVIGMPEFGSAPALPVPTQRTPFVHADVYNAVLSQSVGKAESVRENYKFLISAIGTGANLPAAMPFPKNVPYPKQCSALCVTREPKLSHAFATRFLGALDTFRKGICEPISIPLHDIVIVFEVSAHFDSDLFTDAHFATLSACSGAAGGNKPTFTFHNLQPLGTWAFEAYVGMVLELTYQRKIQSRSVGMTA